MQYTSAGFRQCSGAPESGTIMSVLLFDNKYDGAPQNATSPLRSLHIIDSKLSTLPELSDRSPISHYGGVNVTFAGH